MEHCIPEQEIISYVGDNYNSLKADLEISGNTVCSWLKNTKWEIILRCVFIERTWELIILNTDDEIGKRDTTILEIVMIEKLLKERLNGFLLMKDIFNKAHIRKLNELWIYLELGIDQHNERQVRLTSKE